MHVVRTMSARGFGGMGRSRRPIHDANDAALIHPPRDEWF